MVDGLSTTYRWFGQMCVCYLLGSILFPLILLPCGIRLLRMWWKGLKQCWVSTINFCFYKWFIDYSASFLFCFVTPVEKSEVMLDWHWKHSVSYCISFEISLLLWLHSYGEACDGLLPWLGLLYGTWCLSLSISLQVPPRWSWSVQLGVPDQSYWSI